MFKRYRHTHKNEICNKSSFIECSDLLKDQKITIFINKPSLKILQTEKYIIKVVSAYTSQALFDEVKYAYLMSDEGIGPTVFDTFYYIMKPSDNNQYYAQYIIMERLNNKFRLDSSIVKQMIDLYYKVIKNGIYCNDIKLDNYVLDNTKNQVKMIDFGEFCNQTKPSDLNKFNYINLIQLFITIYDKYSKLENIPIFQPFFDIPGFLDFVNNKLDEKSIEYTDNYINQSNVFRYYLTEILNISLKPIDIRYSPSKILSVQNENRQKFSTIINKTKLLINGIYDQLQTAHALLKLRTFGTRKRKSLS